MDLRNSVISDLVVENPRRAGIFEEYGFDYCRTGRRSLTSVCLEMGLDVDQLEAQLQACEHDPFEHMAYALREESLSALADYIQGVCHAELRAQAMRVSRLLARVSLVYSRSNPELAQARSVFDELNARLQAHMQKEEQIYFDWIRKQEQGAAHPEAEAFGLAEAEHKELMIGFEALRELTDNYKAPDYASGSYRVMLVTLAQLESDMDQFAAIEDNILFRRAALLAEKHAMATV